MRQRRVATVTSPALLAARAEDNLPVVEGKAAAKPAQSGGESRLELALSPRRRSGAFDQTVERVWADELGW